AQRSWRRLVKKKIEAGDPFLPPQVRPDVSGYAYDLDVPSLRPYIQASSELKAEVLADRVFVREKLARQTLADYRDFGGLPQVGGRDSPPRHQTYAFGLEVTWADEPRPSVDLEQRQTC